MITITSAAAEQILISAARIADPKEACLRIAARLDGKGTLEYGMGFDAKGEGDLEAASNGVAILLSPGSAELLAGAILDYVEINPGEARFIFINPNDPSHKAPKTAG